MFQLHMASKQAIVHIPVAANVASVAANAVSSTANAVSELMLNQSPL